MNTLICYSLNTVAVVLIVATYVVEVSVLI